MERHKLWDDRAGKLMERTFEKFGYGKKRESVKEEKKKAEGDLQEARRCIESQVRETIDMNPERAYNMVYDLRTHVTRVDMDEDAREYILDELSMILDNMDADPDPGYEEEDEEMVQEITYDADDGNSLLDMDDYNMLEKAIEGPVRKLISGGHTKEDLLDAFKVMLGFDNVNEDVSDGPSDVQRLAMRIDVLKKRIQNKDGITSEDVVEQLELISSMLQGSDGVNEDETENPEVDRAEDAARKAKIKALQVQLKALRKTQSME